MAVIVNDDNIRIEKLQLGPFGTNAYIIVCQKTRDSLVVDAPAEADKITDRLRGTNPRYILLTHDHMDHVGALASKASSLDDKRALHSKIVLDYLGRVKKRGV